MAIMILARERSYGKLVATHAARFHFPPQPYLSGLDSAFYVILYYLSLT